MTFVGNNMFLTVILDSIATPEKKIRLHEQLTVPVTLFLSLSTMVFMKGAKHVILANNVM